MQPGIKKLLFEFIGAILTSCVLSAGFLFLAKLIDILKLDINLGGDKASVFAVIFFGIPIGCLLGILVVDKIIFKYQGYNLLGISLGFVLCFLIGGIGSVLLIDKIGRSAVFFIPLIIIALSFIGYYIPIILKG